MPVDLESQGVAVIGENILIVAALAADLLQYVAGSSGLLCSLSRKKANWLVLPIWGLFEIKMALVIGAYILILLFLIRKARAPSTGIRGAN